MKGEEFDRGNLAFNVAELTGLDEETCLTVLKAVPHVISEALCIEQFGNRVEWHDFGVFRLDSRAPRHGKTPSGEAWVTPTRQEIVFHASPAICEDVAVITEIETY